MLAVRERHHFTALSKDEESHRVLTEDHAAGLVFDLPEMKYGIGADQLARWGCSFDEAFDGLARGQSVSPSAEALMR